MIEALPFSIVITGRQMEIVHYRHGKKVVLAPGEYFSASEHLMISTLLGSCVSACLFDPVNGIIGMNHFLLSNKRFSRTIPITMSEAGRYGINAMELLINQMLHMGAEKKHFRAKVFGGATVLKMNTSLNSSLNIGEINSQFIMEFMRLEKIPVVASDLGGERGRVINFYSHDYSVYVRKIRKANPVELQEREKKLFQKSIIQHEKEEQKIDLW